MAGDQQTKSCLSGRSERTLRRHQRRSRTIRAFDRDAVHGCDRAGLEQPAWICPAERGLSHQACNRGPLATELPRWLSAILRAVEFAAFLSALDGRSEPHVLSVRIHAI